MYSKDCEDKGKCDLCGKGVEDKKDADLCTGRKNRDKIVQGFVFKDGGDIKISVVLSKGVISWGKDNFVVLMY